MAFTICSDNGRLRICTSDANAAAVHVRRLQRLGHSVRVTDVNGRAYRLAELPAYVETLPNQAGVRAA